MTMPITDAFRNIYISIAARKTPMVRKKKGEKS